MYPLGFPPYPVFGMDPTDPSFAYYMQAWPLFFWGGGGGSPPPDNLKPSNSINVSSYERNTECRQIREKVRVWEGGDKQSKPLKDYLFRGNNGDQYIRKDDLAGKRIWVPQCPCEHEPAISRYEPIAFAPPANDSLEKNGKKSSKKPKDPNAKPFSSLKDDFYHMGYMEQSVCWRLGPTLVAESPPPPKTEPKKDDLVAALQVAIDESQFPSEDADCYAYDEDRQKFLCEEEENPPLLASLFTPELLQETVNNVIGFGAELMAGNGTGSFLQNLASKISEFGIHFGTGAGGTPEDSFPDPFGDPEEYEDGNGVEDDPWGEPMEDEEDIEEDFPT